MRAESVLACEDVNQGQCEICSKVGQLVDVITPRGTSWVCKTCFKKVNAICGVMKGREPMSVQEIYCEISHNQSYMKNKKGVG